MDLLITFEHLTLDTGSWVTGMIHVAEFTSLRKGNGVGWESSRWHRHNRL